MFHRSKNDKMSYGIVGIGRFGSALATELAAAGADIVVIDSDEDKVREMRELTDNAYVVAKREKKTLTETGIQNCDVAVVCIGERMDTSILTTLHLVSLGIPKVIANDSANAIVSMSEANIKAASSGIALDGNDCIDNFDTLYVTTATLQKDYAQYSSSLLNLIKRSEESISRTRAKYRPDSK